VTIAISLKVNDGLVLASDSASTLIQQGADHDEPKVVQVFNNAAKVFNIRKGLPLGLMTWGAGSIGKAAISTLAKDLRKRISDTTGQNPDWHLDPAAYTVEQAAELVRRFMYEEHYVPAFAAWPRKPLLGFIVAGYSSGGALAEEFILQIDEQGACSGPTAARPHDVCGVTWQGEPEAINRLLWGFSPSLGGVLVKLGVDPDKVPAALEAIGAETSATVIYDAMPIQDAIDLAEFLVDVTERFSRYTPGAATVGGPIEIAAITKHEGFKWVKRKHYFNDDLNPREP